MSDSVWHSLVIICLIIYLPSDADYRHSAILSGMLPLPAICGLSGVRDSGFPCCKDRGLQASVPLFHGIVCLQPASDGREIIRHMRTSIGVPHHVFHTKKTQPIGKYNCPIIMKIENPVTLIFSCKAKSVEI